LKCRTDESRNARPPLVSLLAAAAWLIPQHHSISTLREQNDSFRQQLAARLSANDGGPSSSSSTGQPARDPKAKASIDWKKVAGGYLNGFPDMREQMRFEQQIKSMTKDEILAACEEIQNLDLPSETIGFIEQMLVAELAEKDPRFTLDRFIDRINVPRSQFGWVLSTALAGWAKKDLTAATAWFDQQLAAGTFNSKSLDGQSRPRREMESALMAVLISVDPAAVGTRIAALPAGERAGALRYLPFYKFTDQDNEAFVKIVREQIPAKDQADTVAQPAATIAARAGYSKVSEFLNRIDATPEERAASVDQAGSAKISSGFPQKKITSTEIDEFREWAVTQTPDTLDRSTGKLLAAAARSGQGTSFDEIARLAVQYHESSGNDEVLGAFLEDWPARSNKEASRALAEKISDPARREKILSQLK
jgi:hypothetical protein